VFRVVTPCSLVRDNRFYEERTSALKMEAVNFFEMFVLAGLHGVLAAKSSVWADCN
jgi:hypothetical protein